VDEDGVSKSDDEQPDTDNKRAGDQPLLHVMNLLSYFDGESAGRTALDLASGFDRAMSNVVSHRSRT
jgi:hypothetical protein